VRVVIDASAGLFVAASQRGFEAVSAHHLVAPTLFWSESVSSLHQILWRGALSRTVVERALDALLAAPIERVADAELSRRAWAIAEQLGWAKTYDAEYVAVAQALDLPLLTRDARLQRGAAALVRTVGPSDL
jgi:predicted nucleic acid-binding protein